MTKREPIRIIKQPSPEDFQLTPREKEMLKYLSAWERLSRYTVDDFFIRLQKSYHERHYQN